MVERIQGCFKLNPDGKLVKGSAVRLTSATEIQAAVKLGLPVLRGIQGFTTKGVPENLNLDLVLTLDEGGKISPFKETNKRDWVGGIIRQEARVIESRNNKRG